MNELREPDTDAPAGAPPTPPVATLSSADVVWPLLRLVLRTVGLPLAAVVLVITATLLSAGSDMAGVLGAIGAGWFAMHQVQLSIDDVPLGFLPLTPTVAVFAVTMLNCRSVVRAGHSAPPPLLVVCTAVAAPIMVSIVAMVVVHDVSAELELAMPNVLTAMGSVGALHATAAALGVGVAGWRALMSGIAVPSWVWTAIAGARTSLLAIVGLAAALTALLVLTALGDLSETLGRYDVVGALAILLVALLYIPNFIAGVASVLVGATVNVGDAAFNLASTRPGPMPNLPLISGLPEGPAQPYWLLWFAGPLVAGVLLGRLANRKHPQLRESLMVVGLAATTVAVVLGALAFTAGGAIGAYGAVTLPASATFGYAVIWLAGVGASTVLARNWAETAREKRQKRASVEQAIAAAKADAAAETTPPKANKAAHAAAATQKPADEKAAPQKPADTKPATQKPADEKAAPPKAADAEAPAPAKSRPTPRATRARPAAEPRSLGRRTKPQPAQRTSTGAEPAPRATARTSAAEASDTAKTPQSGSAAEEPPTPGATAGSAAARDSTAEAKAPKQD